MKRRAFIKGGLAATAFLGCGSAAYAASSFDQHDLEIKTVKLELGLVTQLRAAVLADIHFDPLYETGYLETVFKAVAHQSPDVIFLIGDYVTSTLARFEEFGPIAGAVRPRLGAFAILGNHDLWWGANHVRAVLEQNGIRVLRNAIVPLPDNPGWGLAGFDSFWAGHPNPAILSLAPAGTQFISLVHEPDAWDLFPDPRVRLQLSGHTHGGQVRAPLYGALRLPSWGKHYDAGLFRRGEQSLYVNRGIGTVRIPYRINCRPEISILDLT